MSTTIPTAGSPVPLVGRATRPTGWLDRIAGRLLPRDPIVVKELRVALRTPLFVRFMYLSTALGGLVTLVAGAQTALGTSPADAGRLVFHTYFCLALLATSLAAPVFGATSIALERETLTLDSLLLTRLSAWRIVRGKFVAIASSLGLLLVASSPVAAISFLFGGVGPVEVALSFLAVLLASLPAIAIGMAISSRIASTRITLLATLLAWLPVAALGLAGLWAVGSDLRRLGSDEGPFWFARFLPEHLDDARVVAGLFVAPLFVIGMTTWFGLSVATAGLVPTSHDRGRPFRRWLAAAVVSTPMVALLCLWPFTRDGWGSEAKHLAEAMLGVGVLPPVLLLLGGLVLLGEPIVRPRFVEAQSGRSSRWSRGWSATFGAGVAPSLRFAMLVALASVVGASLLYVGIQLASEDHPDVRYLLAPLAPLVVATCSAVAVVALAFAVRSAAQSSWLGRGVLIAVTLLLVLVLPVFWALAIGSNPETWLRQPTSPGLLWPGTAFVGADHALDYGLAQLLPLVVPTVLYLALAGLMALVTERRAAKANAAERRRRVAALARSPV